MVYGLKKKCWDSRKSLLTPEEIHGLAKKTTDSEEDILKLKNANLMKFLPERILFKQKYGRKKKNLFDKNFF